MTATERIRAMLDERGVEHRDATPDILHDATNWVTKSWLADGRWFQAIETQKGDLTLELYGYSPEQAIEATLGRGECHTVAMDCFGNPPYNTSGLNGNSTACGCSECGAPWSTMGIFRGNKLKHNFKACPICGRKVRE